MLTRPKTELASWSALAIARRRVLRREAGARSIQTRDHQGPMVSEGSRLPFLPSPGQIQQDGDPIPDCCVWQPIFDAAPLVNPAVYMYCVFDTYPILWEVLGFPCNNSLNFFSRIYTPTKPHRGSFEQVQQWSGNHLFLCIVNVASVDLNLFCGASNSQCWC
ncbi:hypothetical protein PHLGIDRAFT_220306 [Phlebiopsis gigantea 11061_1 CR5-6]|uniref:Uncharacterized protein n=1 Tax=Phlebiopsis gigantea (strain 11061_1 CR5-6) TaxID=745531 RepID=A0A0C3SEJ9_PHLG1|nr:hypothetical protein PHLGIDRAFT_220306 [Phlebiopsis gigantea 11061_1 CR5-6]